MRGFPPLQIFLIGLAFGLVAFPLARLTGDNVAEPQHARSADTAKAPPSGGTPTVVKGGSEHPEGEHKHVEVGAVLRVRFAHRPKNLSLKQEGRELLNQPDLRTSPLEIDTELEISHDGNELLLEATWPEGTPETALTIELEPDGFETRRETRWSMDAALQEVLTFQW